MPTEVTDRVEKTKGAGAKAPKKDALLLDSIDFAREAAAQIARPNTIGAHLGSNMVAERVALHLFECLEPGYPGWTWAVSLSRAPRAKVPSVCELDLLPGASALLAPAWVPFKDRLKPEDVSRADVLPYEVDDARLVDNAEQIDLEQVDALDFFEAGWERKRVLSQVGLNRAAKRWYQGECGPQNSYLRGATSKQTCQACGFLLGLKGSLGSVFGVCANEWSPDDGHVVSLDHSCGAHSETDIKQTGSELPVIHSRVDDYSIATYRARRLRSNEVGQTESRPHNQTNIQVDTQTE